MLKVEASNPGSFINIFELKIQKKLVEINVLVKNNLRSNGNIAA